MDAEVAFNQGTPAKAAHLRRAAQEEMGDTAKKAYMIEELRVVKKQRWECLLGE